VKEEEEQKRFWKFHGGDIVSNLRGSSEGLVRASSLQAHWGIGARAEQPAGPHSRRGQSGEARVGRSITLQHYFRRSLDRQPRHLHARPGEHHRRVPRHRFRQNRLLRRCPHGRCHRQSQRLGIH